MPSVKMKGVTVTQPMQRAMAFLMWGTLGTLGGWMLGPWGLAIFPAVAVGTVLHPKSNAFMWGVEA